FSTARVSPRPPPVPTRRSSDLLLRDESDAGGPFDAKNAAHVHLQRPAQEIHFSGEKGSSLLEGNAEKPGFVHLAPKVLVEVGLGDRKSTRLNSSHVKISYAVFC